MLLILRYDLIIILGHSQETATLEICQLIQESEMEQPTLGKRICAFKLSRKKNGNLVEIDPRVMLMHRHNLSLSEPHQGKSRQYYLTKLKADCKVSRIASETQIKIKTIRN